MIDAEAIVKKLEAAALGGDVQAARTLLERALPVYRVTAEPVMVDGIRCADSLTFDVKPGELAVGDNALGFVDRNTCIADGSHHSQAWISAH